MPQRDTFCRSRVSLYCVLLIYQVVVAIFHKKRKTHIQTHALLNVSEDEHDKRIEYKIHNRLNVLFVGFHIRISKENYINAY